MIWLLLSCAPPALELDAAPTDLGVEITANLPVERVELFDPQGLPVAARTLPSPSPRAQLVAPLEPGASYRAVAVAGGQRAEATLDVPDGGAVAVGIEAPLGQGRRSLADGDVIEVVRVDGSTARAGVHLEARRPSSVEVRFGEHVEVRELGAGERAVALLPLDADGEGTLVVRGERTLTATIRVRSRSLDAARAALSVESLTFPVDAWGAVDRSRPGDRVTLPSRAWERAMAGLGLGWRPRGDQAPWAWQALTLRNEDEEPLSVLIRASVWRDGAPAAAFRSRLREGASDEVRALLRVPAGSTARAVLPVHVDRAAVEPGDYTRVLEVLPLGSDVPIHRVERPLRVSAGSAWASGGLGVALITSALGYGLLAARGRRWIGERRTSDLVTIALFGSLTFVIGAAFQILGMGVATFLGPFAPLLTGLPDDAFRACLLGTLVALLPRPGVVAVATVTGFLMRGIALGSFHPVDLLYLGSTVAWLEGCLWLTGCTRLADWSDAPRRSRWLRLGLGLGLANVGATACALVVSVVFYRLFFAAWYVALVLALPGFLYVLAGAWIAVDFAAALRRVGA